MLEVGFLKERFIHHTWLWELSVAAILAAAF
jgi:hypothetical protein